MADTVLKLCKHCRFFRPRFLEPRTTARCGHSAAVLGSSSQLVTGHAPTREWCSVMRRDYGESRCGADGKLWESKK